MKPAFKPLCLLLPLLLQACASGTLVTQNTGSIHGEKVIGLDAPTAPWVAQVEKRIRDKGFKVKRISRDKYNSLTDTWAQYILVLDGSYYTGWENRCFGGGYRFEYLTAELINMKTNESVLSVSGEGYSENCPPLSGTIYGDIAKAVDSQWQ